MKAWGWRWGLAHTLGDIGIYRDAGGRAFALATVSADAKHQLAATPPGAPVLQPLNLVIPKPFQHASFIKTA